MKTLGQYFLVFDIETSYQTQLQRINGQEKEMPCAVWLSYACIKLYNTFTGKARYKCQFREWEDLRKFLLFIENKFCGLKILCFVHNLSYEADFMFKNLSRPSELLCNASHKVITTTLEEFPFIEFRCTYILSGMSLSKIGAMIGFPKLENDYKKYFPNDEISPEDWEYNERDCDVVAKYVSDVLIKEYKQLRNIPFTKTGRVRKVFKENYAQYAKDKDVYWDKMPPDNCYKLLCDSFRGAITISNPKYTNRVMKNVHSFDEKSKYPSVMLKEKFPYDIRLTTGKPRTTHWIARIRLNSIDTKYNWCWLSEYKMQSYSRDCEFFNGKLRWGSWIETTITEIDFEIINKTYNYSSIEWLETAECIGDELLPEPYFKTLEKFSARKNELRKQVKKLSENDPQYYELQMDYMKAKGDFNSIYGMTVQKLMSPEYEIDENFIWREKEINYKQDPNKHMKRNFLYGIYITAYARRDLINAIIANCPDTFIYADTDSIKFCGDKDTFIETNSRLPEELDTIESFNGLGLFEYEETYEEFLTFGAKKYCYKIDGKYHMTVAGLPKINPDKSEITIDNIKEFHVGKTFKNCKLAKLYVLNDTGYVRDDDTSKITKYTSISDLTRAILYTHGVKSNGGVVLFPTDYTLSITPNDRLVLGEFGNGETKYE